MSSRPTGQTLPFPPNPNFGHGAARRRIDLDSAGDRTRARLVDPFHEMECEILHDGTHVRAVSARMHRYPTTLCPGAVDVLQEFVGMPIACGSDQFYGGGAMRRHCTHLFDLAYLALANAVRGASRRAYDVVVPDELDAPVLVELRCDGVPLFAWTVDRGVVTSPPGVAGLPLLAGFWNRAVARFQGDELEAALVLARTYLISRGRAYDAEAWEGRPAGNNTALRDRCFAYSASRSALGKFRGAYVRDFSQGIPAGDRESSET